MSESTEYILLTCKFANHFWLKRASFLNRDIAYGWYLEQENMSGLKLIMMAIISWHLWSKRNRRIFNATSHFLEVDWQLYSQWRMKQRRQNSTCKCYWRITLKRPQLSCCTLNPPLKSANKYLACEILWKLNGFNLNSSSMLRDPNAIVSNYWHRNR